MRGVAAIFVAMRHTYFFHRLGVPGGYLAVDLFFVLSGFVIAHAYERRLECGLSAGRFLLLRYLRLWPVYVIGAVLGLAAALVHALPAHDALTPRQVLQTAPFALAMLPGPMIKPMLYPVNSVAWSLMLELLVNAAYAMVWRPLRRPLVLAGVMLVSGLALIAAVLGFGKLDIGFQWSDMIGGLPRVVFSFSAGLAIHHLYRRPPWRSSAPAWVWVALLPILLCVNPDRVIFPLACVFLLFPGLVLMAASAPSTGPRLTRLFSALGAASYPLYALHKPVGELAYLGVRDVAPWVLGAWPVLIGMVYLPVMMALCLALERWFDQPARRALSLVVPGLASALRGRAGALLYPIGALLGRRS